VTECEEVACGMALPIAAGSFDDVLRHVTAEMPDESMTVRDNVAYALWQRLRAQERTADARLRAIGLGHRRNERTEATGARTVFRLDTGEVVGQMTVWQANAYLAERGA
jgi:hypothetical protein